MVKIYSARDYLAAFEPWLLEDLSALPSMLEDDTRCAEELAYRLFMPVSIEGKYPVEVWLLVHPLVRKKRSPHVACRRDKNRLAANSGPAQRLA